MCLDGDLPFSGDRRRTEDHHMTKAERTLAYAEAQMDHPDPLLALFHRPDLPRLQAAAEQEQGREERRTQAGP